MLSVCGEVVKEYDWCIYRAGQVKAASDRAEINIAQQLVFQV